MLLILTWADSPLLPPGHVLLPLWAFTSALQQWDNNGTSLQGSCEKLTSSYMQCTTFNSKCSICIGCYYWYYYYFYYITLSSLVEWKKWRSDFTGKEDMFGGVSILKDLVPRELHFYSQAEDVIFSIPAHTMWCLSTPCGFLSILLSSNFLLSPLLWQLSREAIHPIFCHPLSLSQKLIDCLVRSG